MINIGFIKIGIDLIANCNDITISEGRYMI